LGKARKECGPARGADRDHGVLRRLAEILPLFNDAQTVKPAPGVKPYSALRLAGRDVYVREGCYQCHSQMIRTLRFETQRYGRFSEAGESVY
jgi:cytochrome c oxidase cbb3-type subunit 2